MLVHSRDPSTHNMCSRHKQVLSFRLLLIVIVSIYHGSIVSIVLQLDLVNSGHFASVLAGAVFFKSRAKASLAAEHVAEPNCSLMAMQLIKKNQLGNNFEIFWPHDSFAGIKFLCASSNGSLDTGDILVNGKRVAAAFFSSIVLDARAFALTRCIFELQASQPGTVFANLRWMTGLLLRQTISSIQCCNWRWDQ